MNASTPAVRDRQRTAANGLNTETSTPPWWPKTYRRCSVDIHVPDWHPDLLSRFDAVEYVEAIAQGGFQSLLHYANSHVGLALWRTKIGQMHKQLKDGDFFGEVVMECRKKGIVPLAYFSVGFDNWAFETHPDWRVLPVDGPNSVIESRYGRVCFNALAYREYVTACVEEIVSHYDVDGMFFDMMVWPAGPCYCGHCTKRFWREEGAEPPRVIDWSNPVWRAWQAARERWLLEFAQLCTNTAKAIKPRLTVNHQFAAIFNDWPQGVPLELTTACSYLGGDFYGGPAQHSLACKIFEGLTRSKPFELQTSRTRIYTDHVTAKPLEEIRVEAQVAILHHAALMLVDYLNADGTLNGDVYQFLGKLNTERSQYEPFLGGTMRADVAIYFDKNSLYNPDLNGTHLGKISAVDGSSSLHKEAVGGLAGILQQEHLPFGVVTNITLDQLDRYRGVLLPNVLAMTVDQAEVFRRFVQNGGVLYASGPSSLDRCAATPHFLLEDVLGVRHAGKLGTVATYLTPKDTELARSIWPQDHLLFNGPMVKASPLPGAQVLAKVTLPLVEPELGRAVGSRFAAIHSNPPALSPGENPAVVLNHYGKGRAVWVAAAVEIRGELVNQRLLTHLLRRILPGPFVFELEAHPAMEMTLFDQPENSRMMVTLLNLRQQMPQVPVPATVRVQLPAGKEVRAVRRIPHGQTVPFESGSPHIQFRVEPFESLIMFGVEYR